jgi:hypothetical protein
VSDQNPASSGQESFGSTPAGRESFGSVPGGKETFGATPAPAPAPVPPAAPAAPAHAAVPAPVASGPAEPVPMPAGMPGLPPPPPPPVVEPKKKAGPLRWILTGVAVIVIALLALIVIVRIANKPAPVTVGECIDSAQYSSSLSNVSGNATVDCTDPKATHKVIGVVSGKQQSDLNNAAVCGAYPQTVATLWLGDKGKSGDILCLAELSK